MISSRIKNRPFGEGLPVTKLELARMLFTYRACSYFEINGATNIDWLYLSCESAQLPPHLIRELLQQLFA